MRASGFAHEPPGGHDGGSEGEILEMGRHAVDGRELFAVVRAIGAGQLPEMARDRNSICYRARLSTPRDGPAAAIVKAARLGPQRTNADATFAWESSVLAALSAAGFAGAPEAIARVATGAGYFLFMTELPGGHPDPRTHPLDARQLRALLDRLHALDLLGFMHYDLKPANIITDADRATFVDFEFGQFGDICTLYAPAMSAYCEDFNACANPHFPWRSNVANFEFRTLSGYLAELETTRSAAAADGLLRDWLLGKARYHARMAAFHSDLAETAVERIAMAGGISAGEASARLTAAADYERLLAVLFESPGDGVMRAERALMAYRCAVFGRHAVDARTSKQALLAAIGDGVRSLPAAYTNATVRLLHLVSRSVHPPE